MIAFIASLYHPSAPLGLLLQTPVAGGNDFSKYLQPIMLALIVVVFYFFMIRPQQKKAKDQKTFLTDLKKGDRIVTIGGLHGTIVEMNDLTIVIEAEGRTRLKFDKAAISVESTKRAQSGTATPAATQSANLSN
jgi:preprotein translocase subunit YajC